MGIKPLPRSLKPGYLMQPQQAARMEQAPAASRRLTGFLDPHQDQPRPERTLADLATAKLSTLG